MMSGTPVTPSKDEIGAELSPGRRANHERFKAKLPSILEIVKDDWLEGHRAKLSRDLAEGVIQEAARRRNKVVGRGLIGSSIQTMRDIWTEMRDESTWSKDCIKAMAEIDRTLLSEDERLCQAMRGKHERFKKHIGKGRDLPVYEITVVKKTPEFSTFYTLVQRLANFAILDCVTIDYITDNTYKDGRLHRSCRPDGEVDSSVDEKNGVEKRSWPDEWPIYWEGGDPTGLGRRVAESKAE